MDTEDQKPADAEAEEPADADAEAEEPSDADAEAEDGAEQDMGGTTAPSIGPNTTFTRPEDRPGPSDDASQVDAMGLDKHRQVVGGQYGASFARQATLYGGVVAIVAALIIGFVLLAGKLDQPPETNADEAPWSSATAEQTPPAPIQ
jgi:hypothetical protein